MTDQLTNFLIKNKNSNKTQTHRFKSLKTVGQSVSRSVGDLGSWVLPIILAVRLFEPPYFSSDRIYGFRSIINEKPIGLYETKWKPVLEIFWREITPSPAMN